MKSGSLHLELNVPGRSKEDFKVQVEKVFLPSLLKRRKNLPRRMIIKPSAGSLNTNHLNVVFQ
jgi:hypothetical protein